MYLACYISFLLSLYKTIFIALMILYLFPQHHQIKDKFIEKRDIVFQIFQKTRFPCMESCFVVRGSSPPPLSRRFRGLGYCVLKDKFMVFKEEDNIFTGSSSKLILPHRHSFSILHTPVCEGLYEGLEGYPLLRISVANINLYKPLCLQVSFSI